MTLTNLQLGILIGLGALIGCNGPSAETSCFPHVSGLQREEVLRLAGEPSSVLEPPFPEKFESECMDSARRAFVYEASKERTVVVYFDEDEKVLCRTDRFRFTSH